MTLRLALLAALACAALPVAAETPRPSPGAQRAAEEIRSVIGAQIDAFRAGDFEGAFRHASPKIRARFVTAENFGKMVRAGYPMVERAVGRSFGDLTPEGGRLRQVVVLTDPKGRLWLADYWLIPLEGGWRIDGVMMRPIKAQGI